MITRRALTMGTGVIAAASMVDARFGRGERTRGGGRLPVPRLIDANKSGNVVKLKAAPGLHEFFNGKPTRTLGYSAPILGPVLRFRRGDSVEMSVENALDTPTTVHWHGLLVPGDVIATERMGKFSFDEFGQWAFAISRRLRGLHGKTGMPNG